MKRCAALCLTLLAMNARAATAYVSDELVLGVYAEQNQQGARLTTLHSGARVETLATSGEFTQIRLDEGVTGWVKTAYLTLHEPATVRIKQLEAELDRSRATSPALAEAAARSELELVRRELSAKQAELDAARATLIAPAAPRKVSPWRAWSIPGGVALCAVLIAGAVGFWLGYAALARRVKQKFGGIRVY